MVGMACVPLTHMQRLTVIPDCAVFHRWCRVIGIRVQPLNCPVTPYGPLTVRPNRRINVFTAPPAYLISLRESTNVTEWMLMPLVLKGGVRGGIPVVLEWVP